MTKEPRRTRLLASALLVLTFVVGGLVGAATERVLRGREPDQPPISTTERNRPERSRPRGPRSILLEPTVLDQLGVNDKQRSAILALLAQRDTALQQLWGEMEPRINAIRAEFEPRFGAMMQKSRADVRAHLDARQQKILDQLIQVRIQERRAERAKQNQNRNGPDPRASPDSGKMKTEHFE
jgi:hypothetical protein